MHLCLSLKMLFAMIKQYVLVQAKYKSCLLRLAPALALHVLHCECWFARVHERGLAGVVQVWVCVCALQTVKLKFGSQVPSLRLQQRRMRVLVSMLRCTMPIEHTRTWFGRQRNRSLELFPKPGPKVGLDLETALAKSIPNSAALGMKLQNSKCISMPKIVVFGNEFRFCKIQICAQNLWVELVLVFLQFCKFLVGKFLFESFEFESFELEVHGKVYFGSSWKFIQVFESLCGKVLGSKSAILFIDFFCSWGFWVYQNPRINEYLIRTLIIKFQYKSISRDPSPLIITEIFQGA